VGLQALQIFIIFYVKNYTVIYNHNNNSQYILEQKPDLLRNSFQAKYKTLDARDKLTYRLPSHNTTIEGITIGDRDKGTLKALFKLRQSDYKTGAAEFDEVETAEDFKYDDSELAPITPAKYLRFFGEPQSKLIKRPPARPSSTGKSTPERSSGKKTPERASSLNRTPPRRFSAFKRSPGELFGRPPNVEDV
jgi:hypothetical protein